MSALTEWIQKRIRNKAMRKTALYAILITMVAVITFQSNKVENLKQENDSVVKMKNALLDSVNHYQNLKGQWVAEKLTIQEDLKTLEKENSKLNENQKKLLKRVQEINKENNAIVSALIVAEARIDSLKTKNQQLIADTINKTLRYIDSTEFIKYNILTDNVVLANKNKKSELTFIELSLPNETNVDFFWKDDRKEGYPVAFSITNSNKYFKVADIQSYAIPELLKPQTGWDKFTGWINKKGKWVLIGTAGVVSAGGVFLIMR
jgi:predicted nuclease with TOPRIM domain